MKYELTLASKGTRNDFSVDSYDRIVADNLVSLLSQFIVLVASLHRRELEEAGATPNDDDIPF